MRVRVSVSVCVRVSVPVRVCTFACVFACGHGCGCRYVLHATPETCITHSYVCVSELFSPMYACEKCIHTDTLTYIITRK